MNNDHAATNRCHIEGACNAIAPGKSHLPELVLKVLNVWLSNALEVYRFNSFGEPYERRLNVFGQRKDLDIDLWTQGFD